MKAYQKIFKIIQKKNYRNKNTEACVCTDDSFCFHFKSACILHGTLKICSRDLENS